MTCLVWRRRVVNDAAVKKTKPSMVSRLVYWQTFYDHNSIASSFTINFTCSISWIRNLLLCSFYYWIALHHFGFQKYNLNYLMIKKRQQWYCWQYIISILQPSIAVIIFQTSNFNCVVHVIFSSVNDIKHVTKMLFKEKPSSVARKTKVRKRNSACESIFLRVTKMVSQVRPRDEQSSIPFIVIIN